MRKIILVANWKQSGTKEQALVWVNTVNQKKDLLRTAEQIIVCPPLVLAALVAQAVQEKGLPIAVGAQDIDNRVFEGEKNTGEVGPNLLADCATYVIIGHSETRKNRGLTDENVAQKVALTKKHNLIPIVCVSEIAQAQKLLRFHEDFDGIIAYEPLFAIGSGNPDSPEGANNVASQIKEIFPEVTVLYGGSVDGDNVKGFLNQEHISGVLVGNRSLDPSFFLEIVKNA